MRDLLLSLLTTTRRRTQMKGSGALKTLSCEMRSTMSLSVILNVVGVTPESRYGIFVTEDRLYFLLLKCFFRTETTSPSLIIYFGARKSCVNTALVPKFSPLARAIPSGSAIVSYYGGTRSQLANRPRSVLGELPTGAADLKEPGISAKKSWTSELACYTHT